MDVKIPVERNKNSIIALFVVIFFVELIRTAWIGDDAAITLRTVLNFVHGYGPNFNIDERVQAYTHPLWFLLISGLTLIFKNVFAATFFLSIAISLFVVWFLLARVSTNMYGAIISGCALILSKAFVDFSTSGLENPLSHLLILLVIMSVIRVNESSDHRYLAFFFFGCALLYLTRPDLVLLIFPMAVLVSFKSRINPRWLFWTIMIGAAPIMIWTAFSVYYYGFPFPNTAYAKLGTGISEKEILVQGSRYFLHQLGKDPLTPVFIATGVVAGIFSSVINRSLAIGILLYLAYVLSIGGDFMEGRFFTASLLVAAVIISRSRFDIAQFYNVGIGVLVLGLIGVNATILSDTSYLDRRIPGDGIADERGYYYQTYGLLTAERTTFLEPKWEIGERKVGVICGGLGFEAIFQGPATHYIDSCGLSDPLLARLPAKRDPAWRIGHFDRQIPTNYEASVLNEKNLLTDEKTSVFYDSIIKITRSPLNSHERFREIVRFNLGLVDRPDEEMYKIGLIPRTSEVVVVSSEQLNRIVGSGPWNAPGNIEFSRSLEVSFDRDMSPEFIDISVDHNDTYSVETLSDGKWTEVALLTPSAGNGMVRYQIKLKEPTPSSHRVRVTAVSGDGMYSVGHLILR